jgi:predicted RNA-binding Zn ribbon-like protein
MTESAVQPGSESLLVGDHLALDLLNTVMMKDGQLVDTLGTGEDVLRWLGQVGYPVDKDSNVQPQTLLRAARLLRDILREAIERRKAGKPADVGPLNAFLASCPSHLALAAGPSRLLTIERQRASRSPHQLLAPIAEAAAELLATGDFDLVRKCESNECVLWFYDRTKSHHRRWCSMASCGNRHKVAAYRERQQRHGKR